MKVLITGHSGFIGKHVVAELLLSGHEAALYDGDVLDIAEKGEPADAVIHLAAKVLPGSVPVGASYQAYRTNVLGTIAVAEYAGRCQARVLFASSAGVYAPAGVARPSVESDPVAPCNMNGQTKLLAEDALRYQAARHGFSAAIFRIFNVYGPGQRSEYLVPYVLGRLRSGEQVRLRNPAAIRDFITADDVARGIVAGLGGSTFSRPETFNLGGGVGITVLELARTAGALLGSKSSISDEPQGQPGNELEFSVADISKARKILGWVPKQSLEVGLRLVIEQEAP